MTKAEKHLLITVADVLMALATHLVSLPNSPICEESIDRLVLALRDVQHEENNRR